MIPGSAGWYGRLLALQRWFLNVKCFKLAALALQISSAKGPSHRFVTGSLPHISESPQGPHCVPPAVGDTSSEQQIRDFSREAFKIQATRLRNGNSFLLLLLGNAGCHRHSVAQALP